MPPRVYIRVENGVVGDVQSYYVAPSNTPPPSSPIRLSTPVWSLSLGCQALRIGELRSPEKEIGDLQEVIGQAADPKPYSRNSSACVF